MILRVFIHAPEETLAPWRKQLSEEHFWIESSEDREQSLAAIEKQVFHICVWPAQESADLEQIRKVKQLRPDCMIIAFSRNNSPGFVVSCMKSGAAHFVDCSVDTGSLLEPIREIASTLTEGVNEEEAEPLPSYGMVGRSPKMRTIYKLIDRIKNTDSSVLITGESGTGKELVAAAIHAASPRSNRPLVAVNCAAIPATLLESELFGHVRGAFTGANHNRMGRFQMAGRGTLLLDEISELSLDLQAKLLRAIQTRTFEPVGSVQPVQLEARIIAASNQDLQTAVSQRTFREDLFYRLNVIPIHVPPLRQRRSDIPLLVNAFVKKFSVNNNKKINGISEDAMNVLVQYNWPGNVRELENLIERVVVLKESDTLIEPKDFPTGYFRSVDIGRFVANIALPDEGVNLSEAVNDFENELILQALRKTEGNKNQAATLLKLNRTTLVEKLKRKGLRFAS